MHASKAWKAFGLSGFQLCSLPHTLQTDSNSCGVLVCWYAMQLINGRSLTDPCNTSLMRVSIYRQIHGTCLHRRSGCQHIELSKCPICKGEAQDGGTIFECRRCCQRYHAECLTVDQKCSLYCPSVFKSWTWICLVSDVLEAFYIFILLTSLKKLALILNFLEQNVHEL